MKNKCSLSWCGSFLLILAIALPQTISAQTNYFWKTIATPVSAGGGPQGVAVDKAGNIYIADTADDTILKATPAGTNWVVSTIAGLTGVSGTNNGAGNDARFNSPGGLALSGPDTLIIADTANNAIRKLSFNGANWHVTTIAGTAGLNTFGSADGTNDAAQFFFPSGVAADTVRIPNVVYVADEDNSLIRKITSFDGVHWVTTTIAGSLANAGTALDGTNSDAGFNYPFDVAMNSAGELFVADYLNCLIRKLTPDGTNWITTTIAGQIESFSFADGTNTDAQFDEPSSVAVDGSGNVYVSDTYNDVIRRLAPDGTNWVATTIGGYPQNGGLADGTNIVAQFSTPEGVAVDSKGNVYVGDTGNNALRLGFLFPPSLQIVVVANQVNLSYASTLGTNFNFILEGATNLADDSWANVTNQWQLDDSGTPYINLTRTNASARFFRLQLP